MGRSWNAVNWFNTDPILLTLPALWVVRFPPTVPYNLHFCCFPTLLQPLNCQSPWRWKQHIPSKCHNKYHKAHHVFSNLCVNLKTYMTTVGAICQIPVTEAENSFRGPRGRKGHVELGWECCMELSSCTVTVAMDTSVLKLNIEHCNITKCVSCCVTYS